MMQIEKNKILVQIGTNNGKDEFNKICKDSDPSKIILVEPNSLLNSEILANYNGVNNVFIENAAIMEANRGIVSLVIPAAIRGKKSINGIIYHSGHFSLLPMDDWGDKFVTLEAPSMSFNELCAKYSINNIHYLQIDTEGYDVEIIKAIDFEKINIDIICYERWDFGGDAFKRYGDKAKLYGINAMHFASNLLKGLGYRVQNIGRDAIAYKPIINKDILEIFK